MLIEKGYKVARVEQTETPDMMEARVKATRGPTKFDKSVNCFFLGGGPFHLVLWPGSSAARPSCTLGTGSSFSLFLPKKELISPDRSLDQVLMILKCSLVLGSSDMTKFFDLDQVLLDPVVH